MYVKKEDLRLDADRGRVPVISAPTGYGKTELVVSGDLQEALEQRYAESFASCLVLEPTESMRDELLQRAPAARRVYGPGLLGQGGFDADLRQSGLYVCCFGTLANLPQRELGPLPSLVVIDEADQVAEWSLHFDGYADAWQTLLDGESRLVALTATPRLLLDNERFYDATPQLRDLPHRTETIEMVGGVGIDKVLRANELAKGERTLVYVRGAAQAMRLARSLSEAGKPSAYLISRNNQKEIEEGVTLSQRMMEQTSEDGESVVEHVRREHEIPRDIKYLIINDAWATGVSLKDKSVKWCVVESTETSTIIQARGRLRQDLERLTVVFNSRERGLLGEDVAAVEDLLEVPPALRRRLEERARRGAKAPSSLPTTTTMDKDGEVGDAPFVEATIKEKRETIEFLSAAEYGDCDYWRSLKEYFKKSRFQWLNGRAILYRVSELERKAIPIKFNAKKWCKRKLFKKDREALTEEVRRSAAEREKTRWEEVKQRLINSGYSVSEGRTKINGKSQRYVFITPPS